MKKWKHSGLALVDQINEMKPRSVLDVGCGYNEFKGKINNLIGIDPYNVRADYQVGLMEYRPQKQFDIIMALGSINFGGRNKIIAEVSKCVNMLTHFDTSAIILLRPPKLIDPRAIMISNCFCGRYSISPTW